MVEDNREQESLTEKETIKMKKEREHLERLKGLRSSLEHTQGESSVINRYPGKPGLDVENGKYRVAGTVSASSIFTRKGPQTNIAYSTGYCIEEIATGKKKLVTKEEGVHIAAQEGLRNGYIIYKSKDKKDEQNRVIKKDTTIYLQPYPAKTESFTQDDRLISVFKLDEEGRVQQPVELLIKKEDCTPSFWIHVNQLYETKKKRSLAKKRERGIEEKHRKLVMELEAEIGKKVIKNPFQEDGGTF